MCRYAPRSSMSSGPETERQGTVPAIHDAHDLPNWVPRCVGDLAQIMLADLPGQKIGREISQRLHRLVFDPRMKKVWNELQRRKRQDYQRTEIFVNAASCKIDFTQYARWARRRAEQLKQLVVRF
jgi:hypothetical protein